MFRKTKIPENKNSSNGTTYFTVTLSSSYNGYKSNNVGNTSNVNNGKSPYVQESRRTPENKEKRVFILSENIVKHVSGYEISHQIENCKVYIGRFPSTKTEYMKDYAQPTKEKPNHVLIHVRIYYFPMRRQPDVIAEVIIQLALKLKIHSCNVSVSNIVGRNNQYRKKASAVHHKLKDLYEEKSLHCIDHSNSINTKQDI